MEMPDTWWHQEELDNLETSKGEGVNSLDGVVIYHQHGNVLGSSKGVSRNGLDSWQTKLNLYLNIFYLFPTCYIQDRLWTHFWYQQMQNLKKDYKQSVKQKPLKTRNNFGNKEPLLWKSCNVSFTCNSLNWIPSDRYFLNIAKTLNDKNCQKSHWV